MSGYVRQLPRLKILTFMAALQVASSSKSSTLAANAVHHRLDAATSALPLVPLVFTYLKPEVYQIDQVCGIFIAVLAIVEGVKIMSLRAVSLWKSEVLEKSTPH